VTICKMQNAKKRQMSKTPNQHVPAKNCKQKGDCVTKGQGSIYRKREKKHEKEQNRCGLSPAQNKHDHSLVSIDRRRRFMSHMVVNRRKIIIVFPPFPCQIVPVKRPRDCRADARVWLPGECLVTANLNPSYRGRNSGVESTKPRREFRPRPPSHISLRPIDG
jgi:hypothetical protein